MLGKYTTLAIKALKHVHEYFTKKFSCSGLFNSAEAGSFLTHIKYLKTAVLWKSHETVINADAWVKTSHCYWLSHNMSGHSERAPSYRFPFFSDTLQWNGITQQWKYFQHFTALTPSTVICGRVIRNALISSWGSLHNIFPVIDDNVIYAVRWKVVEIFGDWDMTHAELGNVDWCCWHQPAPHLKIFLGNRCCIKV